MNSKYLEPGSGNAESDKLDGARLAVLHNRFEGIASMMGNTLLRTGRSGVLNRGRDFSCCIVTKDCKLLVVAESLPAHVFGAELLVKAMYELHPDFKAGDAFLHNSPYHGNTHAADHTVIVPVFDDDGKHRFTVLCKAHQADIGNSIPTTYHGEAKDVYEEGALIFPCVRVQENNRNIDDIIRMCRMRIRVPEQWYGDYLGMVGAARVGERALKELAMEEGWNVLQSFANQWLDYSERLMSSLIKSLPAGEVSAKSVHDPLPGTPQEGVVIQTKIKVIPERGCIEVDLRDNPDCLPCGLNQTEATARTSVMIGVFNSFGFTVPKNEGSARCIKIQLRKGCVAGIPVHPYSCSVATSGIADRIANSTQRALAKLGEGIGMAECGAILAPGAAVVSGVDPRTGQSHINQVIIGMSAGAATSTNDAWLTYAHVGNGGMSYVDSVELDEYYQPFIVYERRLVPDSGGAGRRRGAPSLNVEYGPIDCELSVAYVCDGIINPAKGVRGGEAGGPAGAWHKRGDERETLPGSAVVTLKPGDRIIGLTQSGGGYGPPWEREPERVLHDVEEGWVSRKAAKEVYGVELTPSGAIDFEATTKRRVELVASNSLAGREHV